MRPAVAFLVILLAGCLEPGPQADPETQVSGMEAVPSANGTAPSTLGPHTIFLTACEGFQTGRYWVGAGPPAAGPEPWRNAGPGSRIVLEGWTCERISVSDFERGPVSLLLEYTDAITPPADCKGESSVAYGLLSIGLDDPALVQHLGAVGLPAYNVSVSRSSTEYGPVDAHEWSWGPPGQDASRMVILDDGDQVSAGRPPFRFYWEAPRGVAAMEWNYRGTEPTVGERIAVGELAQPMAGAQTQPVYAALGAWFKDTGMDGSFLYWGDEQCGAKLS